MGLCTQIQIKSQKFGSSPMVKQPFRVITITLLSLLLPLSFLLLARLSCARFLLAIASRNNSNHSSPQNPAFFSIFLYTNPGLLYLLVSAVSLSTLIHNLSGKPALLTNIDRPSISDNKKTRNLHRPIRLYASWIFLCALQVCVGLGIEGSVALGVDFSAFLEAPEKDHRTLFSRVIFFVGLHETMLHWCSLVVRPVVDDTVLGPHEALGPTEKWARRGALAGGFGSLWYWRLRDEVESLVVAAEAKGEMLMEVGFGDFVGWWLYYLTVTVGMIRVVKAVMFVVMSLFRRRLLIGGSRNVIVDDEDDNDDDDDDNNNDEEKGMISRGSNVDE